MYKKSRCVFKDAPGSVVYRSCCCHIRVHIRTAEGNIQYTSDAEVKDTPFEDVKQAIIDKLTEDEKVAIYNDCLAKWKEEIKIEKYYDRVSGIK